MFNEKSSSLFKSILLAYTILVLHVILISVLGILVIFFAGIINYMLWIFTVASLTIIISGYLFYRRMKKEGKTFRELLTSPLFSGRSFEIHFLGGLASVKVGKPNDIYTIKTDMPRQVHQLEEPSKCYIDELTELARLLESGLISLEEYNIAKKQIFENDKF